VVKETLVLDVECYSNYFMVGFLNTETGNLKQFEMWPDGDGSEGVGFESGQAFNRDAVASILHKYRTVSFNGNNYDMPMISAALRGADCAKLKALSDKIIVNNIKHWNLGIEIVKCDHVDIFEVAPGMASLKIYGGRLHCKKMQDLPIEPGATITAEDRALLRTYNGNDLTTTKELWDHLQPQIELREQMSKVYGIDLRSKSDAQIAEAVIVKQVSNALGSQVQRPEVPGGTRFHYTAPKFITFQTPELQALLATIERLEFLVPDGGNVQMPTELEKAAIRVGGGVYRLGIGGLHSSEQTISHFADDDTVIVDRDVTSYYPMIILNNHLSPAHMGNAFTHTYRGLVEQRVAAKRAGNKVGADTIKIVVNGSFGKLGSKWSKLYSPHLLIQTTITGQLSLLMLIEQLEAEGFNVLSANTDGVTIRCAVNCRALMEEVIVGWESVTQFDTEETPYRAVHSRDVNNYIAIKTDGGVKLKGAYAPAGLMKNPTNEVCVQAVIAFLRDQVPVAETIRQCSDIRRFVTIRQVKGGAVDQDGAYLGKAVRWYYATGVEGPIRYKVNGYTVARSEGAKACMELPDAFPDDINYEWYIAEANSILADVGIDPVAYSVKDLV